MKNEEQSHIQGQIIKTEKVFEILGEGGGICIIRKKDEPIEKFIYRHNEFDPTEEGLSINKNDEYDSFEQAFQFINNRYSWYRLHIETIHNDYRKYISEKLIERLNKDAVTPNYLAFKKDRLEHALEIKLNYAYNPHINSFAWVCENIK